MKRSHIVSGCVVISVALAALVYLPVILVWADRKMTVVGGGNSPGPKDEVVVTRFNGIMRHMPSVYAPLLRFHASINGWTWVYGECTEYTPNAVMLYRRSEFNLSPEARPRE